MASTSNQTQARLLNRRRYDVFLSFRGEDTRRGFTDHLYAALLRCGVHTFRDNEEIKYGKEVGGECIKAIEESKCSIVVLSKGYASSTWCLDELLHIIECCNTKNHRVFPVFIDVAPSDVEQQTGAFKDAFDRHTMLFECDKVQNWRTALTQVACLRGIDLRNHEDGQEARNIEKIVQEILKKLGPMKLKVAIHPVEVHKPAHEVISLMGDSSSDVRIVGLYGMGGIGKTTTAKEVYNSIFEYFDVSCFLENINRKLSYDPLGLDKLRKQLLSQALKTNFDEIYNVVLDLNLIEKRLNGIRVLIILDDVDNVYQFHQILGTGEWLFPGSRVIVTTRYKDLLKPAKFYRQYEVKELSMQESLCLLSLHAFGQQQPDVEYMHIAYEIVRYTGGVPLALEVLGSSLRGQGVDVWNNRLKKLEKIFDNDIYRVLEVSYQSLDDIDKRMFLDIACFFIGKEKNYIMSILGECGHFPIDSLNTLIRKCLVSIGPGNELGMHDLLRDLGREIVRKESSDPGERSRIWDHEDATEILKNETGKVKIEGLVLYGNGTTKKKKGILQFDNPSEIKLQSPYKREMAGNSFRTKAFKGMRRLRLLQLNNVHLTGSFHYVSKNLRWLCWLKFPLDYIPHDLYLGNLVALEMTYSKLKDFPKNIESLPRLKFLDLSHSKDLTTLSNFERVCNLEVLTLDHCICLVSLDESIEHLSHLVSLSLRRCTSLRNLPKNMSSLASLENLNISGCSKLDEISLNHAKNAARQDVENATDFCAIGQNILHLDPHLFWNVPDHILNILPSSLIDLNLSYTNINSLPDQIGTQLPKLTSLCLNECRRLTYVGLLPPSLMKLHARGCSLLYHIDLGNYMGDELDIRYCRQLNEICRYYKLEALQAKTVRKLLKNSNLFTGNSYEVLRIRVMNILTKTCSICPIQGLHYNGIYNIFIPNIEIPSWFHRRNEGSSVFLRMPQSPKGNRIIGFIVASVYECYSKESDSVASPGVGVFNISTEKSWIYEPKFVFLPICPAESILWLSYWALELFPCEGSKICIRICMGDVHVRSCGVHFVYQDEHDHVDPCNPFDSPSAPFARTESWEDVLERKQSYALFSYTDDNEFVGSSLSADDLLPGWHKISQYLIGDRWRRCQEHFYEDGCMNGTPFWTDWTISPELNSKETVGISFPIEAIPEQPEDNDQK